MEFNLNYEKNVIEEINDVFKNRLLKDVYKDVSNLEVFVSTTEEPVEFEDRKKLKYKKLNVGESWGKLFDCAWFNIKGEVKGDLDNLYLALDVSGEALLFDNDGNPIKGFTNGSSVFDRTHGEPGKAYYPVKDLLTNGKLDIWLDAGCNDLFGSLQDNGSLLYAKIVSKNEQALKLYYNMEVMISLLSALTTEDKLYYKLYDLLKVIKNDILYLNKNWLERSIKKSDEFIYSQTNSKLNVVAVGHSHLDLAWLWPIRESERKAVRTITNVFYLLERYEEFRFVISQPQQIIWLKKHKELYKNFTKYVEEGRIELVGGMFVESDTNVPGEESLVRQMIYGKQFYQNEFNFDVRNLWLPDVFGYNGNLPQIIKKCDMDYFMTIKISWNLINKFPYHTMVWKGIDGSEVLAHMPPEGTYNSANKPHSIIAAEENYAQKNVNDTFLSLFGIGDGAGGPGEEHLERIKREKSLPNTPKVEIGRVDSFFEKLNKKYNEFPVWQGELYLENHQGTYTSQANIKKYNRYFEQKLKAVETLLVHLNDTKHNDKIRKIWEEVLVYQFHDIIPGSSIKRVNDETLARYKFMDVELDNILEQINKTYHKVAGNKTVIYNHNNFKVNNVYKVNDEYIWTKAKPFSTSTEFKRFKQDKNKLDSLETNSYIIKFSEQNGYLTSIVDKNTKKEILKDNSNRIRVFKDFNDAWNISDHYREQDEVLMKLVKQSVKQYGDIYEVVNNYEFQNSKLTETILINKQLDTIEFYHNLDWNDLHHMLRTTFDLDIKSDNALCDIQFGSLNRTRNEDNSINKAQFEVCAQNWISISDENKTATLVNNGKYGYYIKGTILELNLLRSTNYPGKDQDIGNTTYSYALHLTNEFDEVLVDRYANEFNSNYLMFNEITLNDLFINFEDTITYSSIKHSEDNKGYVVRLYNPTNTDVNVAVNLKDKKEVYETNMLEQNGVKIDLNKKVKFTPYEVKTLKVIM